jgi:hypothetical protein
VWLVGLLESLGMSVLLFIKMPTDCTVIEQFKIYINKKNCPDSKEVHGALCKLNHHVGIS